MDEFLTAAEKEFRVNAYGFFRDLAVPLPEGTAPDAETVWRNLDGLFAGDGERDPDAAPRLSDLVSVLDGAARRDPRLGRALLVRLESGGLLDQARRLACELGLLAGTAERAYAAGIEAARARGYFSSILMDFRVAQERLAGLVAGAELARLGACRIGRLLERRDDLAVRREMPGLAARAAALAAEIEAVAGALLGPEWAATFLATGGPIDEERTRP